MADFIFLTELYSGREVLVNLERVSIIERQINGTLISGDFGPDSDCNFLVEESMQEVADLVLSRPEK